MRPIFLFFYQPPVAAPCETPRSEVFGPITLQITMSTGDTVPAGAKRISVPGHDGEPESGGGTLTVQVLPLRIGIGAR